MSTRHLMLLFYGPWCGFREGKVKSMGKIKLKVCIQAVDKETGTTKLRNPARQSDGSRTTAAQLHPIPCIHSYIASA